MLHFCYTVCHADYGCRQSVVLPCINSKRHPCWLCQPCSLLQLTPQIPLTVAHVLCCVPGSDTDMDTSQRCVSSTLCVMLITVGLKVFVRLASKARGINAG